MTRPTPERVERLRREYGPYFVPVTELMAEVDALRAEVEQERQARRAAEQRTILSLVAERLRDLLAPVRGSRLYKVLLGVRTRLSGR